MRLGNFSDDPPCDYGTAECQSYQRFVVDKVIPHEGYQPYLPRNKQYLHYDIALIRLEKFIRFDKFLKPVCLPFGNYSRNQQKSNQTLQYILAGWGRTLNSTDLPAKRAAALPVWSPERCLADVKRNSNQICAGKKEKGSCQGDSGGPLMHRFKITHEDKRMVVEGIVSYGIGSCANPTEPSVFTRVRSYEQWIDVNMRM